MPNDRHPKLIEGIPAPTVEEGKKRWKLARDQRQRSDMATIVFYRDECNCTWNVVADAMEYLLAEEERRKPHARDSGKRLWSRSRVRRAYVAEKKLQAEGN